MPQRMHYEVTATVKFVIEGPLTISGATDVVSKRLDLIRKDPSGRALKDVTVTDIHIHRER